MIHNKKKLNYFRNWEYFFPSNYNNITIPHPYVNTYKLTLIQLPYYSDDVVSVKYTLGCFEIYMKRPFHTATA
jgi:hypothetical protein